MISTEVKQNVISTVTSTLENEGIMTIEELKYFTNIDDQELKNVLELLETEGRLEVYPHKSGNDSFMLVF